MVVNLLEYSVKLNKVPVLIKYEVLTKVLALDSHRIEWNEKIITSFSQLMYSDIGRTPNLACLVKFLQE